MGVSQTSFEPPPGLIRLGGTPPVTRYLRDIWDRREFAITSALGEVRAAHIDTVLGNVWHLLNPIIMIAVYYLVFGVILNGVRQGVENFIGYLAVGVFAFQWSTKSINGGARAIVSNQGLIRSLQFPRALLPISTVLEETIAFLPGIIVMCGVVLLTGEGITIDWLLVLPVFPLHLAFNLGGAFVAARAADRFRDTLNLLPYLFRLAFYFSGILYAVDGRFHDAFDSHPWLVQVFIVNPFYCFLSLWRHALMTSQPIAHLDDMWVSASLWAVGGLVVGLMVFRSGEKEFGRG